MTMQEAATAGYATINSLRMYYEIYGQGEPLVLIHGGGSTIYTSFGRIIPQLAKGWRVIAVEMQAHGHTGDRDAPLSFSQDADDVAALLQTLGISKASILGFSNGGQTAIEMGLRHPGIINKLILASAFYQRSAVPPIFWDGFERAQLSDMPQVYADEFLKINADSAALLNMFNRDVQRMRSFTGWTDEQLASITAPTLIINGNQDVASVEHAVDMYRLMPNSQLAILPGGHGAYMGEINFTHAQDAGPFTMMPIVEAFLREAAL